MKKNNRGITLVSLTMYVVSFAILAAIVATITSFFYTNVTDLSDSTNSLGEFEKFNAAFLKEIKENNNKILSIENNGKKIIFSNGVVFSFEQSNKGIYSNNIKMCEGVRECSFSIKKNTVKPVVVVYLEIGDDFAKTLDYVMNSNEVMVEELNDRVILTSSTREWTADNVTVTLSYENIPEGYELQYKLNDGEWTNYEAGVEVTEYNTNVQGRLYNSQTNDIIGENNLIIDNIDKVSPSEPTNVGITKGENSATVSVIGGTDGLSGVAGYQFSLDKINWSEVKKSDDLYTFNNIELGKEYTLYVRTVDNVGWVSEPFSEEFMITVKVTKITLTNKTLTKTGTTNPTVTITPTIAPTNATNKKVTWKSSNTSVATVNSSGVVTYVAAGTATITCTASDGSGVKGTCTVTCSESIKVTKITLANKTLTKTSTATTNPTVTITPTIAPTNATNKAVTWKSSNTAVATVSTSGVVTYKGIGTATITCTASDGSGVKGTCTVTCRYKYPTTYTAAFSGNRTQVETITRTADITIDLTGVSKISFDYYGEVMTSGSTFLGTHTLTHFVGTTSKNTLNLGSTGDGTGAHSWVTKTMTITGGSSSSKLQLKAVGTTESTWYYVAFDARVKNIILIP